VRVFKFLKAAVCKAEQCVAIDMLQKISPGEAELLKDPAYNARLRFRSAEGCTRQLRLNDSLLRADLEATVSRHILSTKYS
jgi:hypothetical protein